MKVPTVGDKYLDGEIERRIVEVGCAYTIDGTDQSPPDGGYEVQLDNGVWYDAYWSDSLEAWIWFVPNTTEERKVNMSYRKVRQLMVDYSERIWHELRTNLHPDDAVEIAQKWPKSERRLKIADTLLGEAGQ